MKKEIIFTCLLFSLISLILFTSVLVSAETSTCVSEGESLGAVVPGNDAVCCEGLEPYIPEGIVGTRGTCEKPNSSTIQVKITPEKIYEILDTQNINNIELKKESQKSVYSVDGTKRVKLLGLFSMEMKITTNIDVETGEIVSMKNPWWSFLAKGQ